MADYRLGLRPDEAGLELEHLFPSLCSSLDAAVMAQVSSAVGSGDRVGDSY
jgi:hypothetical protein